MSKRKKKCDSCGKYITPGATECHLCGSPVTKRGHKYGAKASVVPEDSNFPELAGRRFDSQIERQVAMDLCLRQRAGEISELKFQTTVHLSDAEISWRIDFSYFEDGQLYYQEVKGFESEGYRLKLKLFLTYGDAPIRITRGTKHLRRTSTHYPRNFIRGEDERMGQVADGKRDHSNIPELKG